MIFLNAEYGPNLQVSNNKGASWIPLSGNLEPNACYNAAFDVIGTRVLVGGECPFDSIYLRAGTLHPDMLDWLSAADHPANVIAPFLSNRNVQSIKHKPNTPDVYVGVEGGLLKSTDYGRSFRFVIKNSTDNTYLYITNILFLSKNPKVIVISGGDRPSANHSWYIRKTTVKPGWKFQTKHSYLSARQQYCGRGLVAVYHRRLGGTSICRYKQTRNKDVDDLTIES